MSDTTFDDPSSLASVTLLPYLQRDFTPGYHVGYRMRVEVSAATGLSDDGVFRYFQFPLDDLGATTSEFSGVCSWLDLTAYPYLLPDADADPAVYRLNYVDLVFATETEAQAAWTEIRNEVQALVNSIAKGTSVNLAAPVTATSDVLEPLDLPTIPTTYYVDPAGLGGTPSDTNDGSITEPFATLTKANAVVQPGDTVYLRGGTYGRTEVSANITADGTPGEGYIRFLAYPGETPIIDLSEKYTWDVVTPGVSWSTTIPDDAISVADAVVQRHLDWAATPIANLSDATNASLFNGSGQRVYDLSHYDDITQLLTVFTNDLDPITDPDNELHVLGANIQFMVHSSYVEFRGITFQHNYFGIHTVLGTGVRIIGCTFLHNWQQGILSVSSDSLIQDNYVDYTGGSVRVSGASYRRQWLYHSCYVCGQRTFVTGNFFGRSPSGGGLHFSWGGVGYQPDDCVAYDNYCYGASAHTLGLGGNSIRCYNNVLIHGPDTFRGAAQPLAAFGYGCQPYDPANDQIVEYNYIEGPYGLWPALGEVLDLSFSHNTVNCTGGGSKVYFLRNVTVLAGGMDYNAWYGPASGWYVNTYTGPDPDPIPVPQVNTTNFATWQAYAASQSWGESHSTSGTAPETALDYHSVLDLGPSLATVKADLQYYALMQGWDGLL